MPLTRILCAIAAAFLIAAGGARAEVRTLDDARDLVREKFPGVATVSPKDLDAARREGDIVLIDARSADEFAVSRIPGARRAEPRMSEMAFIEAFGDEVKGKTVVFYCSVGMRSSALAARVEPTLRELGAKDMRSLEGGVFAWSHQGLPLENDAGPTGSVHGYDATWGKLLQPPPGAPR
jgi:rhodanese-related sulfurtransferase